MVTWYARNPECPECFHEPHDDEPCMHYRGRYICELCGEEDWRHNDPEDDPDACGFVEARCPCLYSTRR